MPHLCLRQLAVQAVDQRGARPLWRPRRLALGCSRAACGAARWFKELDGQLSCVPVVLPAVEPAKVAGDGASEQRHGAAAL